MSRPRVSAGSDSLSSSDLAGLLVWSALLAAAFVVLLKARRRRRATASKMFPVNLGLSLWMVLAFVTACEGAFAFFVDRSDAI